MATRIVRDALAGSGIELVASCGVGAYDAEAPAGLRSAELMPGARGVVVAASAGTRLWRRFREHMDADRTRWTEAHPYDAFIGTTLAHADEALGRAGVRFRRFDAAFEAPVRLSFIALARLVGLGEPAPFMLAIHSTHGAWWALRGAWLVDVEVDPPLVDVPPCRGCPAPCVGGWENAGGIDRATPEARARCVVGQPSRYDDDQIAYHYDREAAVRRFLQKSPS
ncbi:MAG TPA: hypothetical protein VF765_01245 [Polyangiaceae bacterium]